MSAAVEMRFRRYDVLCNRYEVIQELGMGGMATVVLARDLLLERRVAIKLLRTDDAELRQRLFNEARISARCQHDNIVVVHHADVHNGWPYIVLEHLSGGPLSALLGSTGCLPWARALEIVVSVLYALKHMHERGIIHRDIKPDNIFLTDSGVIKVLDLGIAKLLDRPAQGGKPGEHVMRSSGGGPVTSSELTRPGTILGTPAYMSPEQWIGREIDQLTDLWACGILMFEMICGRHPLYPRQGNELIATALLDSPMPAMATAAPPCVPHAVNAIVDACLRKDKSQRWPTADDLLTVLLPLLPSSVTAHAARPASDAASVSVPWQALPAVEPHSRAVALVEANAERTPARPDPANDKLPPVLHIAAQPPATMVQPLEPTRSLLLVPADSLGGSGGTAGQKTRLIRDELERGIARDRFELVDCPAPETYDLLRLLRKHRPVLVYFAGGNQPVDERRPGQALFGNPGGLYLRRNGVPQLVTPTGLQETFGAAGSSVKMVILDASYTNLHADALLAHVDVVVGTPGSARPEVAEAYARGLFGALGDGESAATAHRHACAAVTLQGLTDDDQPQMRVRRGIDASRLVLAR